MDKRFLAIIGVMVAIIGLLLYLAPLQPPTTETKRDTKSNNMAGEPSSSRKAFAIDFKILKFGDEPLFRIEIAEFVFAYNTTLFLSSGNYIATIIIDYALGQGCPYNDARGGPSPYIDTTGGVKDLNPKANLGAVYFPGGRGLRWNTTLQILGDGAVTLRRGSPPCVSPANMAEAMKPIVNVTEPRKESLRSNSTELKKETVLYVHTIYQHPYLVKSVGGVPVRAVPENYTNGQLQSLFRQEEKYETNNTGWIAIHPINVQSYLLYVPQLGVPGCLGGPCMVDGTQVTIRANQTMYATLRVPPPGERHRILNISGYFSQKGFASDERSHFTLVNGTSASFTLSITTDRDCQQEKDICADSDFPLRVEFKIRASGMGSIRYTLANSTYAQRVCVIWVEYCSHSRRWVSRMESLPPNDPKYNLTDVSISISQNPVFLGRNDRINVTVTLTAQNNASYGFHEVSIYATVYSADPSSSERVLHWMVPNICHDDGICPYRAGAFYLTLSPFPFESDTKYFLHKGSHVYLGSYLGNGSWLRLNYDGTLDAGSDSGGKQIGWWDVIRDRLIFTLPSGIFGGQVISNVNDPKGSSIVLVDGSTWSTKQEG